MWQRFVHLHGEVAGFDSYSSPGDAVLAFALFNNYPPRSKSDIILALPNYTAQQEFLNVNLTMNFSKSLYADSRDVFGFI